MSYETPWRSLGDSNPRFRHERASAAHMKTSRGLVSFVGGALLGFGHGRRELRHIILTASKCRYFCRYISFSCQLNKLCNNAHSDQLWLVVPQSRDS